MEKQWSKFYKVSGWAAIVQLAIILVYSVITGVVGAKPESAEAFFRMAEESLLSTILVSDLFLLPMLALYFITFLALWKLLKDIAEPWVLLSVLLSYIAVILTIASNTDFALIHLALEYLYQATAESKQLILASAKALIANNMWNSTAGFFSGIFLQGSGVLISFIMLKSNKFRKLTGYAGIWGNGFDLIQHLLHYLMPAFASVLLMISGIGYFIWYLFLGLDLLKISKAEVE